MKKRSHSVDESSVHEIPSSGTPTMGSRLGVRQ